MIFAVDPSAICTGWAVGPSEGSSRVVESGVWIPERAEHYDEGGDHAVLCCNGHAWIEFMLAQHQASLLVMEHSGGPQIHRISERLRGAMLAAAAGYGCAVILIMPNTWQSWAVKTIGWSKDAKSDEGDARAIYLWARHQPYIIKALRETT